jgi:hypothetical protein
MKIRRREKMQIRSKGRRGRRERRWITRKEDEKGGRKRSENN